MSELIELGFTLESIMVDKSNSIELQYPEVGLHECWIWQHNIKILLFDIRQEQVIQNVKLLFLFQGLGE